MLKILKFIWQLPQDLLALIMVLWFKIIKCEIVREEIKGINYYFIGGWYQGISLGDFVILGKCYKNENRTINHEWGHTRQSLYFGPLYLILIGLPSALGNIYDRIFHSEWDWKVSSKWYYNQPWEKWADKLGGVDRSYLDD